MALRVVIIVAILLTVSICRGEEPKVYATIKEPEIRQVAFSPDGKTLAIRSGDADLVLWDVASRTRRAKFERIVEGGIFGMAFLFDGKSLAINGGEVIFRIDLATGKATELYRHGGAVPNLVASADGRTLASRDWRNEIIAWDVVNSRKLASIAAEKGWDINDLALFPDGRTLAGWGLEDAGRGKFGVWLWDIQGKKKPRLVEGQMGMFAISPDGKSWAAVGEPGVLVWDTQTDKLRAKWRLDIDTVSALSFSPNGRVLIAVGGNEPPFGPRPPGLAAFIDTSTGKLISSVKVLPQIVGWMSLSPDGKLLAVSARSPANEMRIFDVSGITTSPDKNEKK